MTATAEQTTRETRNFEKTRLGHTSKAEAYTTDGGKTWHWTSNDAVCPLDACAEYGIPCDVAAQTAAKDEALGALLAEYRRNYQPPTGEEIAEMRAAFGPGHRVVNIITGDVTDL